MDSKPQSTEHDADVLRSYESADSRVVVILPGALEAARWPHVCKRLREVVMQSPPMAVVIDCRQLPSGAVEQTGPMFYELLILGRRRLPRVEICAIGRPDQSTGDSQTFVAPARLNSVEAALAFLKARNQNPRQSIQQSSAVSQRPIEGEWQSTPSWLTGSGPMLAMLLITAASLGAMTYSAIHSFAQPRLRAPLNGRAVRANNRTQVAVHGTVAYFSKDGKQNDGGALIRMWPVKPSPREIALDNARGFEFQLSPDQDQFIAKANEKGEFALIRSSLTVVGDEDYFVLVLSANRQRSAPPDQKDLDRLANYFDDPKKLLESREYSLHQIKVTGLGLYEHHVVFGTAETPPVESKIATGEKQTSTAAD